LPRQIADALRNRSRTRHHPSRSEAGHNIKVREDGTVKCSTSASSKALNPDASVESADAMKLADADGARGRKWA
jgi:hypothetical protein